MQTVQKCILYSHVGMCLEEKSACWFRNGVCRNKFPKLSMLQPKYLTCLADGRVGFSVGPAAGHGEVGKGARLLPRFCAG